MKHDDTSHNQIDMGNPVSRQLHGIRLPEDEPDNGRPGSIVAFAVVAIGGSLALWALYFFP